jgi:xanthine dehydrogenase YagS FAD-binding subunit
VIEVPAMPVARRSVYLKFCDRESYEFARASVAVTARVQDGAVADLRPALGGVGTKLWHAACRAKPARPARARARFAAAAPRPPNAFNFELEQRATVRPLATLTNGDER